MGETMTIFSVYIAGMYPRRDELARYADQLRSLGIVVTSRWLETTEDPNHHLKDRADEDNRREAIIDLEDAKRADAILFFSEDPSTGIPRGGRHVEYGYCLALGKIMFVVGVQENIFHFLPKTHVFKNFREFYEKTADAVGQQ